MTDDDLKALLDANAAETKRHFDEAAERLAAENRHYFEVTSEATRHEIRLVAEKVTQIDEKLERRSAYARQRSLARRSG